MPRNVNLLIGGTSHTGKSTLCAHVSTALHIDMHATDDMARHPGRPWPDTRAHVAEFYAKLSDQSIHTFLLHHHQNMWPHIRTWLDHKKALGERVLLEGSALRPEYLATLSQEANLCVCLCAPSGILKKRIHASSGYATRDADHRHIIDRFVARTLADNQFNLDAAAEFGIECVDVSVEGAFKTLQQRLIAAMVDESNGA